ncbi:acyl carrier protein [Faecalicatena contorta]|uniref:acyl carrier protein n=1 Tax=Faecalicatena contorta TaxID=39482 RepID=UPI001F2026BA|nr:acyl carrier protein [Faecalicatena contorta]MCF2554065.1 acyl carrier protein [Faecalicatena contorta]MCF2679666.1 acyl carrier protein [Faecalicatena contorta]
MIEEMKELIAADLGVDPAEVTETASFKEDLGADSLDLFELVMAMEEKYDVEIPSEDLEQLVTVGDAIKYIEAHK